MDKKYNHAKYEKDIYNSWEKAKSFKPKKGGVPYCIIMPPPNANDPLHIGHALFVTIEDILTRYHRMKGYSALWLPGTDHAGIETQYVFEKKLNKKGKTRFDFDRKTLYKKIWDYVQENSKVAINQMKVLGASADWSRTKFTLDKDVIKHVLNTFYKLNKKGLIYRDLKLVNFCTHCGTAFSNLEVQHIERTAPLYYVRYPLADKKGHVVVATTRPEPIYVDTHLAINPKDKKNAHLKGQKVKNPLTGSLMDIITDDFVDPDFGTGIVKLTPAHDQNDFEAAKKHNLPIIQAISTNGKMKGFKPFEGLFPRQARKKAVEILKEKDLIEKIDENYNHTIGVCYRCKNILEPLPLPQFFIKVRPLTKRALKALDKKETVVIGAGHDKILTHWLKNLEDWNISRQIVWGIRLPVYYDTSKNPDILVTFIDKKGESHTGNVQSLLKDHPLKDIKKGLQNVFAPENAKYTIADSEPSKNHIQETDTFDTWFSSAQWPFVTLKTNDSKDFNKFYPTSVMETGYDILPFWVMRMLMIGLFETKKVPFKTIYLHGLVRDEKGQKMSKSKNNVINPLDVVEKYGADALRMALVMSTTAGKDSNTGETKIRGMRNLTNKIYNAARFISMQDKSSKSAPGDKDFHKELAIISKEITNHLDNYRIGLAAETLYNKFWHFFCDSCIEQSKNGSISPKALKEGLLIFLKLFHPFTPFVTEAIYQELYSKDKDLLITAQWPTN